MSYGVRSGGTVRAKRTIDGRRVDVITATCECCRVACHDNGRTAAEARSRARARGWLVELHRVRTLDGGETRIWRVLCPHCPENKKGPDGKCCHRGLV